MLGFALVPFLASVWPKLTPVPWRGDPRGGVVCTGAGAALLGEFSSDLWKLGALLLTLLVKVQFNRAQVMCTGLTVLDLTFFKRGLKAAFEFSESLFKNTASALSPLTDTVDTSALIDMSCFVLCLNLN